jgi:hypothetical protein
MSGFASLYPPDGWIPASAGMTVERAEGQSPFAEGLGVSPNSLLPPRVGDQGG